MPRQAILDIVRSLIKHIPGNLRVWYSAVIMIKVRYVVTSMSDTDLGDTTYNLLAFSSYSNLNRAEKAFRPWYQWPKNYFLFVILHSPCSRSLPYVRCLIGF